MWGHPGRMPSSRQDPSACMQPCLPIHVACLTSTPACSGGSSEWVRGPPPVLVPEVSLGLLLWNWVLWFQALRSLLCWGFVGEKSYFSTAVLVLKMLTQRLTSSWLQHSLSPSPCSQACGGCEVVIHLQTGPEAETGQSWWGRPGEVLPLLPGIFTCKRLLVLYPQPRHRTEGQARSYRFETCYTSQKLVVKETRLRSGSNWTSWLLLLWQTVMGMCVDPGLLFLPLVSRGKITQSGSVHRPILWVQREPQDHCEGFCSFESP